MKCNVCFEDIDDDDILAEAKEIKKRRLTEEQRRERSERARNNVTKRWDRYKEQHK